MTVHQRRVNIPRVGLRMWCDGEKIAEEHLGSRWRTVDAIANQLGLGNCLVLKPEMMDLLLAKARTRREPSSLYLVSTSQKMLR